MKRPTQRAQRAVPSNWRGFPCPACAQPLQYWMDEEAGGSEKVVNVLLVCPAHHCWEEHLSLETLHSSLFVERRRDLEGRALPPDAPRPSATP